MPYTIEKKVQPVMIQLYCNCGKEMKCSNEVLTSYPARYVYYCECGEAYTDEICYPTIEYREVEQYERYLTFY